MLLSARFLYLYLIAVASARSFMKRSMFEKRQMTSHESRLECMSGRRSPGEYYYISPGIEDEPLCGLFILGMSNQLIELEFTEFDVDCNPDDPPNGIVMVVDGWMLNGEYFPGFYDHSQPIDDRIRMYCGDQKPRSVLISEQNAVLIQFFIPKPGQGFRVTVRMTQNHQPCNVISTYTEGLYTIRNFGRRINCSMSIHHPEKLRLLSVDVGVTPINKHLQLTNELSAQCNRNEDYVQLLGGNGLDPDYMPSLVKFCGQSTKAASSGIPIGCNNTVIRVVSSGKFYNSVTFSYREPSAEEIWQYGSCEEEYVD